MHVECAAAAPSATGEPVAHTYGVEDLGGRPVHVALPGIHHTSREQPDVRAGRP
jgi:hypothetical protein